MRELIIANANVVLPGECFFGSVRIVDGVIADLQDGSTNSAPRIDFDGDYLLPGLVELHTDALERHLHPRAGIYWPAEAAVVAHDAHLAAVGVTTVFDALCIGVTDGPEAEARRISVVEEAVNAIARAGAQEGWRAQHLLHLRLEINHPDTCTLFERFREIPPLRLVSIMDHTPGERQYRNIDEFRKFHSGRGALSEAQLDSLIEKRRRMRETYGEGNRRRIRSLLAGSGITLASHDDTTAGHVRQARDEGATLSEFPTTLEAAEAARALGLRVVMGAPNLVLGRSHSGNVSAGELAARGLIDCLSSDYVPVSLLQAVFTLAAAFSIPLYEAAAMATRNPAAAAGLDDRGEIAAGKRADLIRVRVIGDTPRVLGVWSGGRRVA